MITDIMNHSIMDVETLAGQSLKKQTSLPCKDECIYQRQCGLHFTLNSSPCSIIINAVANQQLTKPGIDAVKITPLNNDNVRITAGSSYGRRDEERTIPIPGETRIIQCGNIYRPTKRSTG